METTRKTKPTARVTSKSAKVAARLKRAGPKPPPSPKISLATIKPKAAKQALAKTAAKVLPAKTNKRPSQQTTQTQPTAKRSRGQKPGVIKVRAARQLPAIDQNRLGLPKLNQIKVPLLALGVKLHTKLAGIQTLRSRLASFRVSKESLPKEVYIGFVLLLVFLAIRSYKTQWYPVKPANLAVKQDSFWCEPCRATKVQIPAISLTDNTIAQMQFDPQQKTWPTPITGIGTPAETVANNVVLFGHSKWLGKENAFASISKLKPRDLIVVTDQFGKQHTFIVTQLELVNRYSGDAVHAKAQTQLTLLTSARFNGEWLLPTRTDAATIDTVDNNKDYAIFVVTAKPLY